MGVFKYLTYYKALGRKTLTAERNKKRAPPADAR
jgi:hypothetical protein